MNTNEIINIVKESILSEIQNNPTITTVHENPLTFQKVTN